MKYHLTFLFIVSFISVQSKDSLSVKTRHVISIQTGINQVKEENLHPKVSTGTITQLTYGFEIRKKSWQNFHFDISYSRLKTKLEDISKSVNLRTGADYGYTFLITDKEGFDYYLGPEIRFAYNMTYFPDWDDSHIYWADYLSLGIRNNITVPLWEKYQLNGSLSIPLFSVFSRPELYRLYKIDNTDVAGVAKNLNREITPAHYKNLFYLFFQAEFRFPVLNKKAAAVTYNSDWIKVRDNDGLPFRQLSHRIGLKIIL